MFQGTRQDNVNDRQSKGRNNPPSGEKHPKSILTWQDIDEIREKYASGEYTQRGLALEYGLKSHHSIYSIIKFKRWIKKP